jgi:hypothetical protein
MTAAITSIRPNMLRWLTAVRSPNVLALLFVLIASLAITFANARLFFVDFILPTGDGASNDILVTEAKRFALFHGHYSRMSFYHPGPFYFQWMAFFEWLFLDVFHVFISPVAAHHFSMAFFYILAFALYLRLWLIWSASIPISIAALLITNAVSASIIGRNYVVSIWPGDFYPASSLMVVTGFIGMATRGPSWLPLFVFGLAQLVHLHASFIGLAPIMILTAAFVAWLSGRLPFRIWAADNAIAYVKSHPVPFIISAIIAVLFALPMLINTIVAWPGEFPKYFRFTGHNSLRAAVSYVISFVPLRAFWTLIFLLPVGKFATADPTATDCRFVGLAILAIAGVPAFIYAYRGVDNLSYSYLLFWILPFVGAALASAILYFSSFFSSSWLRFGIISVAAVGSLYAYRVWTAFYPDTRSTALTATALGKLADRAVAGKKIIVHLDRDPVAWGVWPELVTIIAAMNRTEANFLCVEPRSWHLLFHEQYRCGVFDKASEIIHVVPKGRSHGDRIAELADADIIPAPPPLVGAELRVRNLDGAAIVFLGSWSNAGTDGRIWSDGKRASLSFDTRLLPPRFAISIRIRLFPSKPPPDQKVRITDDQGRQVIMLTNRTSQEAINARIELARPPSGNMMTLGFEISRPIAPREIGYNRWDRRSLGIGIEQIMFTEVTAD